jgi:hypothetical protein
MSAPSTTLQRLLTAAALLVAFVFMASIFSPESTRAGQRWHATDRDAVSTWMPSPTLGEPRSVDPHEGLRSLGQLDGLEYSVRIYDTSLGTRYSVIELANNCIVGTLLTIEDVERFFPELRLKELQFDTGARNDDRESTGPLMLAEPKGVEHW